MRSPSSLKGEKKGARTEPCETPKVKGHDLKEDPAKEGGGVFR